MEKKIKTCKKRNIRTIDTEQTIGDDFLEFSQRLLTLKETQMMTEYEVDIFENEDVFSASLEANAVFKDVKYDDVEEEDKEKFVKILHKLKMATESVNLSQYIYKMNYIKLSLKPQRVFKGSLKVNGVLVEDEDEIIDWIETLDEEVFEELYNNTYTLTNPTEEEFIEVEK